MKNLKSKIKVVATLLMLTLVVAAKVAPIAQNNTPITTLGIGYDNWTNY
nr:hypothetical protein [uncultured Anaerocolumna sp.]